LLDARNFIAARLTDSVADGGGADASGQRWNGGHGEPVVSQKLFGFFNRGQTEKAGVKPRLRVFWCGLSRESVGQPAISLQTRGIDPGQMVHVSFSALIKTVVHDPPRIEPICPRHVTGFCVRHSAGQATYGAKYTER